MPEVTREEPAIDGWFTTDKAGNPHLLGGKCPQCGTYVFPPRADNCPNPACGSDTLESVGLSTRGKLWSYTENRYARHRRTRHPTPLSRSPWPRWNWPTRD
ncbi:hypothetical protein RN09_1995 [Mycobacterium tuberculosis variant africanum]|nr:hypothetical protein RN09_1995 [Mycobacterium tuberculosis variant africanum]